jgi:WD40 repeat protein
VERAGFSPDGRRAITAARDGTARIWDADTGTQLFAFQPVGDDPTAVFDPSGERVLTAGVHTPASLWNSRTGAKVLSVSSAGYGAAGFNPDGRSFLTSNGGLVFIWNAENGALMQEWSSDTWPWSVAFSPDGNRLVIGGWGTAYDHHLALWDVRNGTEIARLAGHKSDTQLQGVTFSHDGRRIATVSLDGSARVWDGNSGRLLEVLGQEFPNLKLSDIGDNRDQEMNSAFSPDDRLLATASVNGPVRIWNVARGLLFTTIGGQRDLVEHLEFSPADGNVLLTASHDGTARLWDVDGILTTNLLHDNPPTFAVFSPDNVHLLTGGGDSAVHLWDTVTGRKLADLDTQRIVNSATFSPDGSRIATANLAGRIRVWDVASRSEIAQLKSRGGLLHIQFSPKGDLLAASSGLGTAQLWDVASGAEAAVIQTSATLSQQVIFSKDGDVLLAVGSDNQAHLLRTDGTEVRAFVGHNSGITAATFSPDGQLVATASFDHTARIWSTKDGSSIATLKGHGDELVAAVAFSPDARSLLTASRDGTVRIWTVPDGKEKVVLKGRAGGGISAQFSPNGRYVLTASSQDRAVRLWSAQSGDLIAVLVGQEEQGRRGAALTRAVFNSDGTRIAIVSGDESVHVIRTFGTPADLIQYAKQTVPRELTACERKRFFLPVEGAVGPCPN